MWLPLHDDRFAAPVRVPMGKAVQRTASSASDRGSCEAFFPITGRGQQCVELVDDVMVTLSGGRGQQCCQLVVDVLVTHSVGRV